MLSGNGIHCLQLLPKSNYQNKQTLVSEDAPEIYHVSLWTILLGSRYKEGYQDVDGIRTYN